jgi:hypothetical protein
VGGDGRDRGQRFLRRTVSAPRPRPRPPRAALMSLEAVGAPCAPGHKYILYLFLYLYPGILLSRVARACRCCAVGVACALRAPSRSALGRDVIAAGGCRATPVHR